MWLADKKYCEELETSGVESFLLSSCARLNYELGEGRTTGCLPLVAYSKFKPSFRILPTSEKPLFETLRYLVQMLCSSMNFEVGTVIMRNWKSRFTALSSEMQSDFLGGLHPNDTCYDAG